MPAVKKKRKKKEPKEKQVHRVYVTYFPNGNYYIGYSGKTQKLYEKYYGSSRYVLEYDGDLEKETIAEYTKKSHAKCVEAILQWENRHDEKMLNDMWNVRLRLSHLSDLTIPEWSPKNTKENLCFS
tara:strand:+ start:383 stop:760 length:378 start_codon:yes stop_codon:yes gene_type:complete